MPMRSFPSRRGTATRRLGPGRGGGPQSVRQGKPPRTSRWPPGSCVVRRDRGGDAEPEPIRIVELEHPRPPEPIFRLVRERPPRRLHPRRSCVDIGRNGHVDLRGESLPLHPVPTRLAIILVEDDAAVARSDEWGHDLAFVLERHFDGEPTAPRRHAGRRRRRLARPRRRALALTAPEPAPRAPHRESGSTSHRPGRSRRGGGEAVSYTHLTLPTNREV